MALLTIAAAEETDKGIAAFNPATNWRITVGKSPIGTRPEGVASTAVVQIYRHTTADSDPSNKNSDLFKKNLWPL